MKMKDAKKGMIVKMNKKSNGYYAYTTEEGNCVCEILGHLRDNLFNVRVLSHKNNYYVGKTYVVQCDYFDLVSLQKVPRSKVRDLQVIIKNDITKVILDDYKVGEAKRNAEQDVWDEEFAILLATARALGMSKVFIQELIDLYFDGVKKLKDYKTSDILIELSHRVADQG